MEQGVQLSPLPESKSQMPPLNAQEIQEVYNRARRSEDFFSTPQDVEWTYEGQDLVILQSRPITTLSKGKSEDNRGWYLSLHRSFDNLKSLREKIETELIPAMISVAEEMAQIDLTELSDQVLAQEINRRWETHHKWVGVYWDDFIPFAHGVRLFGQVYNDVMQPEDTYEFIDLLAQTKMASLERNRMLEELADRVRHDPQLAAQLENGDHSKLDQVFLKDLETFIQKFGDLSCAVTGGTQCVQDAMPLFTILREMASHPISPPNQRKSKTADNLKENFLNHFDGEQQARAVELLDLARTSYQLRDDDNVYLGRIEAQLLSAIQEARQRIQKQSQTGGKASISEDLKKVLDDLDHGPETLNPFQKESGKSYKIKPRQLVGQPAGPGISRGKARVIKQHVDLTEFKSGEVLICDAVDPNMTFVVPLASGVVERRGGMLIHGAIIAREYGLPCVTGIPDATRLIQTGDEITVDGYLGIVTLGETGLGKPGGDGLKENSVMDFEGT
jgi:pyruvate,water dikinase